MISVDPFHPHSKRQRAIGSLLVIALALCLVGAAFFRTQILRNSDFALRSDDNRLRVIPIPAPRGTIYDRHGHVIAETVTAYALFLRASDLGASEASLRRLAKPLALDSARVSEILRAVRRRPGQPVLVAGQLGFEQAAWVEERRAELPGLVLEPRPMRHYPRGGAVAHLVGYVGEVSRRELEDPRWSGAQPGQMVGKAGVERQYEKVLAGKPGERYVEVDARGRIIGSLAAAATLPPVRGKDIELSLDLETQRFIDSIFPAGHPGAVVAMVPSTGEVLALYSRPTYDPNQLTGGATPEVWARLSGDAARPLLNRATAGIYPPGSTWKLATALIGLEKGLIDPASPMPMECRGGMSYAGRYSRCWKTEGHGRLDLVGAIANSCNVYFYQLGIWLGLTQLTREGTRLGFSRKTGVDLPGEQEGTFPAGSGWYRRRDGRDAPPSEVMNLAIGQGPNSQTPIRMAQFFSALAGDGTAPAPRLGPSPARPRAPETDLKVAPATLRVVREGMAGVMAEGGTAYLASLPRWKMYGKTGTAQNPHDPKRPHAWFTGFAGPPDGRPEIVIAVIVEFGKSGSAAAAPIAAKIADFHLSREHGLPVDSLQTRGEKLTGRPFQLR